MILLFAVMSITSVGYAKPQQHMLQKIGDKLCPGLERLSEQVMQARQKGLPAEQVKDHVVLGFQKNDAQIATELKNTLQIQMLKLVDEVQYFPILAKNSEQKVLINSYKSFVLSRCQAAFAQTQA